MAAVSTFLCCRAYRNGDLNIIRMEQMTNRYTQYDREIANSVTATGQRNLQKLIEETKGIFRNKIVTPDDLQRGLVCAEWSAQYSNKLSKETSELLTKFVEEIILLNKEIQKDMDYMAARDYSDYLSDSQSNYDCGEL